MQRKHALVRSYNPSVVCPGRTFPRERFYLSTGLVTMSASQRVQGLIEHGGDVSCNTGMALPSSRCPPHKLMCIPMPQAHMGVMTLQRVSGGSRLSGWGTGWRLLSKSHPV